MKKKLNIDKLWKIYFWLSFLSLTLILLYLSIFILIQKEIIATLTPADVISWIIVIPTFIGLYLYAFKKQFSTRRFWQVFFWLNIVLNIYTLLFKSIPNKYLFPELLRFSYKENLSAGDLIGLFIFQLPILYAVYQLAYNRKLNLTKHTKEKDKKKLLIIGSIIIVIILLGGLAYFQNRIQIISMKKFSPNENYQAPKNKNLPAAPTGFTWQDCPDTGASFLLPDGWRFNGGGSEGIIACFLSKDGVVDESGAISFKTGLTVNVRKNLTKSTGKTPSQIALEWVTQSSKQTKTKPVEETSSGSPFTIYSLKYSYPYSDSESLLSFARWIANDKTGTLYFMSFAAPESEWDSAWQDIGQKMTGMYIIDDEK